MGHPEVIFCHFQSADMSDTLVGPLRGLDLPGFLEDERLRGRTVDPGGRGGTRDPHDPGRRAGRRGPARRRLLLRGGRQAGRLCPHSLQLARVCRLVHICN